MSAPNSTDPNLTALCDDLAALKRDVAGLIEHLKQGASNGAQSATEQVDKAAHRLCSSVTASGEQSVKEIGRQVEEHPLLALVLVLGVGYIGGRLLSR
jgi:ElaB/YqjD/DUF883 family membrane-anchored ribosome-binding protein